MAAEINFPETPAAENAAADSQSQIDWSALSDSERIAELEKFHSSDAAESDELDEHDSDDEEHEQDSDTEETKTPAAVQYYTPQEFSSMNDAELLAIDAERLPGSGRDVATRLLGIFRGKIEPQLMELETLREQNKRYQEYLKNNAVIPGQDSQTQPDPQEQYFKTLNSLTEQQLGLKPGEFDEYNSNHAAMKTMIAQELSRRYSEQRIQASEAERVNAEWQSGYNNLYSEMVKHDPNFPKIEQALTDALTNQELSLKEFNSIRGAFENRDLAAIKEIFVEARRRYYEQNGGTKPTGQNGGKRAITAPPHVVSGNNSQIDGDKAPDYSKLASMSERERIAFYVKHNIV